MVNRGQGLSWGFACNTRNQQQSSLWMQLKHQQLYTPEQAGVKKKEPDHLDLIFLYMLVVGLTGGIACGKSSVSAQLQRAGIPVIDADALAKQTTEKGRWGYRRVMAAFGPRYLLPNGDLDRVALGQLVFSDAVARRRLNAATHTPVAVALLLQLLLHWLRHTRCVVLDMPLLVETHVHRMVSIVVVVSASPTVQLQRLMLRDGSSAGDAQARIDAQLPLAQKEALAQVVLHNDGDRQALQEQVSELVRQLQARSRSWCTWLATPSGLLLAAAGVWAACSWARV